MGTVKYVGNIFNALLRNDSYADVVGLWIVLIKLL